MSVFFFKKKVCMSKFYFILYFPCWICNLQPDYIPHKCQWINFLAPQCRELAPLLVYSCVYVPLTSLPWASFGRSRGKEARDCRRRQESTGLFSAQSWVSFVVWGDFVTFLHIPEPWFPRLNRGSGGHKQSFELQDAFIPESGEFPHCHGTSWEASLIPWTWVLSFSFTSLYLGLAG